MLKVVQHRVPGLIVWILALLLLPVACSSTPKTTDGSEVKEKDGQKAPLYYDFGDVLIPL